MEKGLRYTIMAQHDFEAVFTQLRKIEKANIFISVYGNQQYAIGCEKDRLNIQYLNHSQTMAKCENSKC